MVGVGVGFTPAAATAATAGAEHDARGCDDGQKFEIHDLSTLLNVKRLPVFSRPTGHLPQTQASLDLLVTCRSARLRHPSWSSSDCKIPGVAQRELQPITPALDNSSVLGEFDVFVEQVLNAQTEG